ncbi:hypothetical protein [Paenibacillus sp. CF384]|uniref:hypothetical protein n=1 Tax=Paenibacillus sp. CF384 TaxID=1884382 RepID=UPI00089A5E2B|nr:hypothetical protein [Paenibacillus sp. CF384]SDW23898.1 hypothetical protein SAMN05518855_1001761 [Paenibacillus sp. CF384]
MKRITVFFLVIFLAGCQMHLGGSSGKLHAITLAEAYSGDISKVTRIELLNGSSGEHATVEDKDTISQWINQVKDLRLKPDDNQEPRTGYVFGISLFEGDVKTMRFTPNGIGEVYYESNSQFEALTRSLFEKAFGHAF